MPWTKIVLSSAIDRHNDFARYAWSVVDASGDPVMKGVNVVEFADDGRLKLIVLFDGSLTTAWPNSAQLACPHKIEAPASAPAS